jgi:hypothetical protein
VVKNEAIDEHEDPQRAGNVVPWNVESVKRVHHIYQSKVQGGKPMTHETKRFAVADPRTFDGDPYEVAERAFQQAEGISRILEETLADARVMALNAEMSRQIEDTGEADASAFEQTVLARQIDAAASSVTKITKSLGVLGKAAAFNPKAKIGRE